MNVTHAEMLRWLTTEFKLRKARNARRVAQEKMLPEVAAKELAIISAIGKEIQRAAQQDLL
jgi:hypothetical protein